MSDFRKFCLAYWLTSTATVWIAKIVHAPGRTFLDGVALEISVGLSVAALVVALFGKRVA